MSENLQVGIYRLKNEIVEIDKKNLPKKQTVDITYLTKLFREKKYKSQIVQPNLSDIFEIHLFFKRTPSKIRWKDFISKIADSNQDILKHKGTNNENYILLLRNIKSDIVYATTGGFGHTALQSVAESDFGIEILSRIVKAEDKTLRSTKEKNLTGGILGEVKFFRNEYNLNENESFGNFYQELHSSLNRKLLIKIFGFSQQEIDSECLCVAKNSFSIKKSISFNQLISIIERCENLIDTVDPIVEINAVKKLNKTEKVLISKLEKKISKSILEKYQNKQSEISIELCHKDFDKYLHADTCFLKYKLNNKELGKEFEKPLQNIQTILDDIKSHDSNLSKDRLNTLISRAHIECKTNDGDLLTSDLLSNHFYTEIYHQNKSYFLADKEWYEIKDSFTKKLNEQCQSFINDNRFNKALEKWNYSLEKENDFNAKHIGKQNFLVFDKITPENIEACDILHWDSSNIYLIHVKAGFDNSMRDLSHQIHIAARRIKEDSKDGYSFLTKMYNSLKNTKGKSTYMLNAKNQLNKITEKEFIHLFKKRKLIFVLAVLDTATTKRDFKNIKKYDSNIAKFSLHELVKNMRSLAIDFRITEISK
ncbi:hypothetical protein GQR60_02705 [Labilibaculum sp. A4]|uniref:DUF6119 family protein n=1 Tax=Labilibaculum euxinus TaxID=2686357 RepID=UPI000F61A7EC|nr:DUF6119 family protein [Labilibaculum euxinus]MDQ1770541.1 TIGR04141 family sporadically distributed protein [Labilibaculum euxinus]MWN75240.1 hypothetical protein [Labilibaculum euxinus]